MLRIHLFVYPVTLILFIVGDLLWLGLVAKAHYHQHLGHLLADETSWGAAVAFYLMYAAAIGLFAVHPALQRDSMWHATALGGAFGGACYATYELTNLAVLRDWPVAIVPVDIAWGVCLTGAVATAGWWVGSRLKPPPGVV